VPTYNLVDYGGAGDGVTNNATAFATIGNLAKSDVGLVSVVMPSGTVKVNSNVTVGTQTTQFWSRGIANYELVGSGQGVTTLDTRSMSGMQFGGLGQTNSDAFSARLAEVLRGATSVTLVNAALASLFTEEQYALFAGFDLQGVFEHPTGFPSNNHHFFFRKLTDITGGALSFATAITEDLKATWPEQNDGNSGEIDAGGPATAYALGSSWDGVFEGRDFTILQSTQTYTKLRDVTWRRVTFGDAHGAIPSENETWRAIDCDGSACNMEVDKYVGEMILDGGRWKNVKLQSSSVDLLTVRNGFEATTDISGLPKRANIDDAIITTFAPGAYAYGRSLSANVRNSTISTYSRGGFLERGVASAVSPVTFDQCATMANGIIKIPNGLLVTGAADNGSGKVRLTVTNPRNPTTPTAAYATGQYARISSVGGIGGGLNGSNRQVTVVDDTHLDITAVTFSGTYTSGGRVGPEQPARWAVPGKVVLWDLGLSFTVLDVYQDANFTYVLTDWTGNSGAFPTTPINLQTLSLDSLSMENCTGCIEALDHSFPLAQGKPQFAYCKRTYNDATTLAIPQPLPRMIGRLVSVTIDVTTPYTNSGALQLNLSRFNNWTTRKANYSTHTFAPTINLRNSGTRIILPTDTDTNATALSGDTGMTVPEAIWFNGTTTNDGPTLSKNILAESAAGWPAFTIEILTEIPGVARFVAPLRLGLRA
jgi:hypothetical protein